MAAKGKGSLRLVEIIAVIFVLVLLISILMPSLQHARKAAMESSRREVEYSRQASAPEEMDTEKSLSVAKVKSFEADVELTPMLSKGTEQAESIYEAKFAAKIIATNPTPETECEISLPLPPQVISLSDVTISVNGEPNEDVFRRDRNVVWHGRLDKNNPTDIKITFTAVGKGIYTLEMPSAKILDKFKVELTANDSDIRMLELSLQPEAPVKKDGKTIYKWNYDRLMIGRPIQLDILGIAPMDKLGELVWLGPVSVFIFGVLVALFGLAYAPDKLDRWMLMLIVGTFTAAYPLMYFAQEFMPLTYAIAMAAAVTLVIIAVRSITLFGFMAGIVCTIFLAGGLMALTLVAATHTITQGLLLTFMAIGAFIMAMILLPKAHKAIAANTPAAT